MGRTSRRRPAGAGRRCAVVPRGHRPLRTAASRSTRWWSPTTCTPITSRRAMRSRARTWRSSRAAPPRAPRRLPGRARRARAGGRRDLRRRRASAPTGRCGAASCSPATSRCAVASGICSRCGFRAGTRRRASRGGWRARGCWPRATVSGWRRRRIAGRSTGERWEQVARDRALRDRARPMTTSVGACSTPSRRSAACVSACTKRDAPRCELEAAATTRRALLPTRCRRSTGRCVRARPARDRACDRRGPGRGRVAGARQRRASTTRWPTRRSMR